MPQSAFISVRPGIGNKVIEFRWPTGRDVPQSIRKLTTPEFVSALDLAANLVETHKGGDTYSHLVSENTRMSKYITDIESKVETKLESQMNEHTELLLSNHFLLKSLVSTLVTKDDLSNVLKDFPKEKEKEKEKEPHKENRWQLYVKDVVEKTGLPWKDAMRKAKETYVPNS
jgi:hypothetical protein